MASAIRSLVYAMGLQLECARILQEPLFVPILMYGSKKMILKEKERFRIRAVQMDNPQKFAGYQENG